MEESKKNTPPNFNELELQILDFWKKNNIFEKSLNQTSEGESFVFYDGPPFATGLPHYGSILPSVIKDAIPRYQTMKGRSVRRKWGWDCHGLPIENMIEQNLGISGKKQIEELGIDKFNQACRDSVLKYVDEWGKTVSRIARWVDFDHSYKTMDTTYMESVWWALKETSKRGLVYEDRKVLLYCPRCETPISNFEVAMDNSYREIKEASVYVKFKLLPNQVIADATTNDSTYVLAWTTTPWTLPGNTALNIGPDIVYCLVSQGSEKYILAKERLSILKGDYTLISEFQSGVLFGLAYEPLFDEFITHVGSAGTLAHRILTANFVTTTDGTGVVHNAAMYGEEDYLLAKEKALPREPMLDHKGQFLEFMGDLLKGVFFKDANRLVLDELASRGLVYREEEYSHSYPFCWRCGTQLYYNAIPAWFIDIQKIKKELLQNNESVSWFPDHLKHGRFKLGIENAPDWNISRNRYWATPLPFWKCQNSTCKSVRCIGSVRELIESSSNFSQVYPNFDVNQFSNPEHLSTLDLHRPYIDKVLVRCLECGGDSQRIPEVIDCWVESGSMPFAELHYPFESQVDFARRFPSDFVVEYIPQTRAWFYVMHVMSSIIFNRAPFRNVITTGTILAEDGTKMSKSKKNYPDPNLIIEKYGADALRFYLLTSPVVLGEDMNFSEKGVDEVGKKMNLLMYNIWSFYRTYTKEKLPDDIGFSSSNIMDIWAYERLKQVSQEVTSYLDKFDTVRAGKILLEWVNEFSTWYVRRSRERLKDSGSSSQEGLRVYGLLLKNTAVLLAPFMPFLSDFIFKDITSKESVHLEKWPEHAQVDLEIIQNMEQVRLIVSFAHALRKNAKLSVRQPLESMAYKQKAGSADLPEALNSIILEELNIKSVAPFDSLVQKPTVVSEKTTGNLLAIAIDTELSEALKTEGLARELERQIQDLRKKSGFKVGEIVDVYYNTQEPGFEKALLDIFDRKKTFVNQIKMSFDVEVDYEVQAEIGGRGIWLGIAKL